MRKNALNIVFTIIVLTVSILLSLAFINHKAINDSLTDGNEYGIENAMFVRYKEVPKLKKYIYENRKDVILYVGSPENENSKKTLSVINDVMYQKDLAFVYFDTRDLEDSKTLATFVSWLNDILGDDLKDTDLTTLKDDIPLYYFIKRGRAVDYFDINALDDNSLNETTIRLEFEKWYTKNTKIEE